MLEIKFGESDYSIEEGSGILSSPIYLQFRNNQNPFKVMLSPVTVATAEEMGLGFFINSFTIAASSRATKGTQLYKNNCGTYSSYVSFSLTVPFLKELLQILQILISVIPQLLSQYQLTEQLLNCHHFTLSMMTTLMRTSRALQ